MVLTSRQVAEKLGVSRNYVTSMAKRGLLPSVPANHDTPSGRTNYGFDAKTVAEFRKTFIPPPPKAPKTVTVKLNGNGHAPNESTTTQMDVLMLTLGRIEGKIDQLLAVWK